MSIERGPSLLDQLRDNQLLEPAQLEEIGRFPEAQDPDPRALGKVLWQRGWLTRFQINAAANGRARELLVGPYLILDRLGEGGMGQVYKAQHRHMNRVVALKVIRKEMLANPDAVQRFYNEVQAAAQLAHPHIVMAYDAGQAGNTHYLAMEFVEGTDLAQLVKQHGPLPVATACDYVRQAALGLQHAHERGLVHRDIKPSNLLVAGVSPNKAASSLTPDPCPLTPVVKILDMGLARLQGAGEEKGLTQTGAVIGTPEYLAPEQAVNSRAADIRSDIYSLGCTLYFLLTGQPPFQAESLTQILLLHQLGEAEELGKRRPDIPAGVQAVVRRMIARDPQERYQTPAEVVQALEPFASGKEAAGAATLADDQDELKAAVAGSAEATEEIVEVSMTRSAGRRGKKGGTVPVKDARTSVRRSKSGTNPPVLLLAGIGGGVLLLLLLAAGVGIWLLSTRPKPSQPEVVVQPPQVQQPPDGPPAKEIINSIGMKLALIPAGKFWMGSPADEKDRRDDEVQHEVEITRPFYLGVFEVTQEDYQKVMSVNPSYFSSTGGGSDMVKGMDTRRFPVESVAWHEAMEFCRKLSELPAEKAAGRVYRLPTEAEWEYACRGGAPSRNTTAYHFGATLENNQANFGKSLGRPTTTGSYPPNGFGLHDMHGNVWEWCQDWYGPYDTTIQQDPQGPPSGTKRVLRGASWSGPASNCRSAWRHSITGRSNYRGFRVVCVAGLRTP